MMQLIARSLKIKKLAWKGVVIRRHQSLNLQILSLTIKNKMPIMMKTNLQIFFPLSCFHLHRYKTQKIHSCHLYLHKAQVIYHASYNLRQYIKKNPPVAEIFFSASNGRKVFCPICNIGFSTNTIEEHADLCLESKTKFFFEKHTESSDEGEVLDIAQNVSETKGNYDQNQLMLDIEKVLRKCKMDRENELQIHGRRGFCFADFLKTFRKPYNAKKKSYRYIVTFIGESTIDTG